MAIYIAKILQSLLVSHDSIGQSLGADYASIYVDLMKFEVMNISRVCMRALAYMSGVKSLLLGVCDCAVVVAVSALVDTLKAIPMDIARDAAKFLGLPFNPFLVCVSSNLLN